MRPSQGLSAHLVGAVGVAKVQGLDVARQGGDERITLHRPPRLLAHAASMPSARRVYVTAIARADQTSREMPNRGPGTAFCGPRRLTAEAVDEGLGDVGVLGARVAAQRELRGPARQHHHRLPVGGLREAANHRTVSNTSAPTAIP